MVCWWCVVGGFKPHGQWLIKTFPKLTVTHYHPLLSLTITLFCHILVQFEGSLGCLTTASVHNPRKIIELKGKATQIHSDDVNAKENRRYKELLLNIEEVGGGRGIVGRGGGWKGWCEELRAKQNVYTPTWVLMKECKITTCSFTTNY